VGKAVFGWHLIGSSAWVVSFTQFSIWLAVTLTLVSGCLYLWRNRQIYLDDL
jgi:hypothetical protein